MSIKVTGTEQLVVALAKFRLGISDFKGILRKRFRQETARTRPQIPVRSGSLRQLFGFSLRGGTPRKPDVEGSIGYIRKPKSQHDAVARHVFEVGATIVPKKGKYLWIPIGSNRDAAGHAIRSPRDIEEKVIHKSKAGNLIAFEKVGQSFTAPGSSTYGHQLIPVFALKTAIVLPARPVIAPLEDRIFPEVEDDVNAELKRLAEQVK